MCNLFFCKKSNRCKEWYLMIIIGKWILYWKAFLCLSMIYYILLQTSTGIISLKNTTTNRHIESANLIYIALGECMLSFKIICFNVFEKKLTAKPMEVKIEKYFSHDFITLKCCSNENQQSSVYVAGSNRVKEL